MADFPTAGRQASPVAEQRSDVGLRPPTLIVPIAIAAGALALAVYPSGAEAFVAAFVAVVLVVLAAIDLEHRVIPNRIVLPAFAVILVAQLAFYPHHALEWIASAVLAALALLIPRLIRPAWMGMGDVKLMLVIGAGLGWSVVGALLLAFVCVFPASLVIVARGGLTKARTTTIAFGPFLALGALIELIAPHL
jgi:leader peptidase (prepilin peptidase) / N-methyltransferase